MATLRDLQWMVVGLALGGVALACGGDEYCTVAEDERGSIAITCPDGTSSTVPSCYEELPDLDGNGVVDGGDCARVGVGPAVRELCREPSAWLRHEECRASDLMTIPGGYGVDRWKTTNFGSPERPELAAAFSYSLSSYQEIGYVHDHNSNGVFDPEEVTVVADQELCGAACTVRGLYRDYRYLSPPPLLLFQDGNLGYLWHDDDRNYQAQETEIRPLGELLPTSVVLSDHLIAAGVDHASEPPTTLVWIDADGDYTPGDTETQILGQRVSRVSLALRSDDMLVAVYEDFDGTAYIWEDSNKDRLIESNEQRLLLGGDCSSPDVIYYKSSPLYICDPYTGATLHYGAVESSWPGAHPVQVSIVGDSDLAGFAIERYEGRLWYDLNHDGAISDTEIRTLGQLSSDDHPSERDPFLEFSSGTFLTYTINTSDGTVIMVNVFSPEEALFLNEPCDSEADRCAGQLTCRVSGFADQARCVPPEPV